MKSRNETPRTRGIGGIGWRKELHTRPQPEIIEDELTRQREWKANLQERHDRLVELNAPQIVIDDIKELLSKSLAEVNYEAKIESEKFNELKQKYRKDNPPNPEVVESIYKHFDLFIDDYKDDIEVLYDELSTEHRFYEGWFWGEIAPYSSPKYYDRTLSKDDETFGRYDAVFALCNERIKQRLKELGLDL